jgi:hypothetical protein
MQIVIVLERGIYGIENYCAKEAETRRYRKEYKMLSIIEGRAEIIDRRKKSCIYVGLRKFEDTVRNIDFETRNKANDLVANRLLDPP